MSGHRLAILRIQSQLLDLERLVGTEPSALDQRVPRVSGWSVRQQVDHMLKVLALGLSSLSSGGAPQASGMNLLGRVLMTLDWIPRGRAKCPKAVLPQPSSNAEIAAEIGRLRGLYESPELPASPVFDDPRPTFPHPRFGGLSASQDIAFLGMHTHHHWKIVRDIRKAALQDTARESQRA